MTKIIRIEKLPLGINQTDICSTFSDLEVAQDGIHLFEKQGDDHMLAYVEFSSEHHASLALKSGYQLVKNVTVKVVASSQVELSRALACKMRLSDLKTRIQLVCEWVNCNQTFNDRTLYLSHINHTHVFESSTYRCQWQGCYEDSDFPNNSQFQLHLSCHAYQNQLMAIGQCVIDMTKPKPVCYMDPSGRNVLNFTPTALVCGWQDCGGEFFDAETFFLHVDNHAIEDIDIPITSKARLKKSRFAKCEWINCNLAFLKKSHLKAHLCSHSNKKNIACPVCGGSFATRAGLLSHCYRQETPTVIDTDQISRFEHADDDEAEGILTIDEDANPSSIVIRLPSNLQSMIPSQAAIINPNNELSLACSNQANDANNGIGTESSVVNSDVQSLQKQSLSSVLANPNVTFLVNFNSIDSDAANSTSNSSNVIQLQLAATDASSSVTNKFKCTLCSKSFHTGTLLREHTSKHCRQHRCPHCPYEASHEARLKEHILFRHSNDAERKFKCEICDATFKAKRFLHRHVELHNGKTVKCDLCEAQFTNYYSLSRHVRNIHLEQQVFFACHLCERKYNRGCNLSRHLIASHSLKVSHGWTRFTYVKQADGVFRINTLSCTDSLTSST